MIPGETSAEMISLGLLGLAATQTADIDRTVLAVKFKLSSMDHKRTGQIFFFSESKVNILITSKIFGNVTTRELTVSVNFR